jgi:hypothetical protein
MMGFLLTAVCASAMRGQTTAPSTAPSGGATMRVQSFRISREVDYQKRFARGGYFPEGDLGVTMQLLLSLDDVSLLPLTREGIVIDTFVDDTYQNLLGTARDGAQVTSVGPQLSDDGQLLLFTIQTRRSPAAQAGRVFVRGTVQGRAARGALETARGALALKVGAQATVGTFATTIRSISDNGRTNLSVVAAVDGDASRIRRIRVLADGDRVLQENVQARFDQESARNSNTFYMNVPTGTDEITLEYQIAQRIEPIQIPFEAQVDIGQVKAGPIGAPAAGPAALRGGRATAWPPPARPAAPAPSLPPRRPTVPPPPPRPAQAANRPPVPAPTTAPVLEKTAIDLFGISINKPAPGEVEGVKWANPPGANFRAAGLRTLRLMVTTPDRFILAIPPNSTTITRFEDNLATHPTAGLLPEELNVFTQSVPAAISADGRQALLTIMLAGAPAPGATSCTIAGSMRAKVSKSSPTVRSEAVPLFSNQSFKAGPYEGTFTNVVLPAGAEANLLQTQVAVNIKGPVNELASIELEDTETKQSVASLSWGARLENSRSDNLGFTMMIRQTPPEQVVVRIRYNDGVEMVEIPFEIKTGIGL